MNENNFKELTRRVRNQGRWIGVAIGLIIVSGVINHFQNNTQNTEIVEIKAEIEKLKSPGVTEPCEIERVSMSSGDVVRIQYDTAQKYRQNYQIWATSNPYSYDAVEGYNLPYAALQAMMMQAQSASVSTSEAGYRTYFGRTGGSPPINMLLIYPLDNSGELLSTAPASDIYGVMLKQDYVRPCPPHCD